MRCEIWRVESTVHILFLGKVYGDIAYLSYMRIVILLVEQYIKWIQCINVHIHTACSIDIENVLLRSVSFMKCRLAPL